MANMPIAHIASHTVGFRNWFYFLIVGRHQIDLIQQIPISNLVQELAKLFLGTHNSYVNS